MINGATSVPPQKASDISAAKPDSKQKSPERLAAEKLEAAFVSEFLKFSGLGKTPKAFGGGAGEDGFASFLREAQAKEIVKAGGLGLAATFETALKENAHVKR